MGLIFCLSNLPRLKTTVFAGALALFGVLLATSRMRTAYIAMMAYLAIGYLFGAGLRVRRLVPVLVAAVLAMTLLDAYGSTASYLDPRSKQRCGHERPSTSLGILDDGGHA
jgi:hypothetical protein